MDRFFKNGNGTYGPEKPFPETGRRSVGKGRIR